MTRKQIDANAEALTKFNRWHVVAWYRTDSGLVDVEHDIEELAELQELIERGPNWLALERIDIRYRGVPVKLTIEEAEKL